MKLYFVVFNIHKYCYCVEYVCYVVFICQLISLKKYTVKTVENNHSQKDQKLVFKTNYRLMQVKNIRSTFIKVVRDPCQKITE